VDVLYRERWFGFDVRRRAHFGIEFDGCAEESAARTPPCTPPKADRFTG